MTNHHDDQLEMDVSTIQPNEAFLLYTEVFESWDSSYTEVIQVENEYGCGEVRYIEHKIRATANEKSLSGIITDDLTLSVVKSRMVDYASRCEADAHNANNLQIDTPKYKPNFEIKVTYILEKSKRIVLTK